MKKEINIKDFRIGFYIGLSCGVLLMMAIALVVTWSYDAGFDSSAATATYAAEQFFIQLTARATAIP